MTKEKLVPVSLKMTLDQRQELEQKGAECGMTRPQYMMARLFIDQDDTLNLKTKTMSSFDRDLIKAITINFFMLQQIAKKVTTKEQVNKARQWADALLVEKGYKEPGDL